MKEPAGPSVGRYVLSIPNMFSYQGKLLDGSGNPVLDTTYSVTFRLYTVPSGGSSFWNETQTVRTSGGLFSVLLGSVAAIVSIPQAGSCYLGMKVGADPEMTPRVQIASAAYAFIALRADTANYALTGGGSGDNSWVRIGSDSVLYTVRQLGLARGGAGNVLLGSNRSTQVNFGVGCTTGTSVSGFDTCCYAVGGGKYNSAVGIYSTVSGGYANRAWGDVAAIGGGRYNSCASSSVVAGGINNAATVSWATIGGGRYDTASGNNATVAGGRQNVASATSATVGGGAYNTASGTAATIPGGQSCTATGNYGFATNQSSDAPNSNAAAFNGTTTNASDQTSVSLLKQGFGTFAFDHPLDPEGKILNQYVAGSNEALMTYRGVAMIGSNGKVEAQLPDYFDVLNRNPMIQLTGVGSADVVYVSEEEANNRFVIGGKPGMKVFWTVTGERKDPTAEIGRLLQPVEMAKTGSLRGVSLDDAGLVGTMQQLEQMGLGGKFQFRTAAGRQRYEDTKRLTEEDKK
jgi:hypothetical protein